MQTAWKLPTACSSIDRAAGEVAWSQPTRALTENTSYATASLAANGTEWLKSTFSFTEADFPADAEIDLIEFQWKIKQTAGLTIGGGVQQLFEAELGGGGTGTIVTVDGHVAGLDTFYTVSKTPAEWGYDPEGLASALQSGMGIRAAFEDNDYNSTTISCDVTGCRITYSAAPAPAGTPGDMMLLGVGK